MAEQVYIVIRTNCDTDFEKTMLLEVTSKSGEIPLLRLNSPDENTSSSKSRRQKVTECIENLVHQEFDGLTLKRVRCISYLFVGKGRVRVFLAEYIGWPEPKDGHHHYFFAGSIRYSDMAHKSRRIIRLVDAKLHYIAQKNKSSHHT